MKYTIQQRVLFGVCKIWVCTLWLECVEDHFQGNLQITPDGLIMTTERENRSNGLELIIGYLASLCSFSSLHRTTNEHFRRHHHRFAHTSHQTGFHWLRIQFTILPKILTLHDVARVSISLFPVPFLSSPFSLIAMLRSTNITLMTLNNKHTWTWSFIRTRRAWCGELGVDCVPQPSHFFFADSFSFFPNKCCMHSHSK